MNVQYPQKYYSPLKILIVNPLSKASQLTIVKILSGTVFGQNQIIDLIMVVYTNEIATAEAFRLNLMSCAFSCMNSIEISSALPSVSDADVFCFITNFPNPNCIDFSSVESNEHFDTFYLIIKIAHNFSISQSNADKGYETDVIFNEKNTKTEQKPRKPVFMADGLVTLNILKSFSRNIPTDLFFCPTPLTSISKCILADYLKVRNNVINEVLVWAANDEVFHVEIEKPLVGQDKLRDRSECDGDVTKDVLQSSSLDHTQFNDSWMRKDFIEKIARVSSENPYGCIYKADSMSKTLQAVWAARSSQDGMKSYDNSIGVISDGSLGTLKGLPYVLPVLFHRDGWSIDRRFEEDTHLKLEIKRINKAAKEHHEKLIRYCKKFLEDNVINHAFVTDAASSTCSVTADNTISNI